MVLGGVVVGKKSVWLQCVFGTLEGNLLPVVPDPPLVLVEKSEVKSTFSC